MEPRDRIDEWDQRLDKGLAEYGHAEPRVGLENRIFANLRAEKDRLSRRRWLWVLNAMSAAAVIVMAIWLGSRYSKPVGKNATSRTQTFEHTAQMPVQTADRPQPGQWQNGTATRHVKVHLSRARVANRPKLDQFPSPRPLSEQEKLLQEYVEVTPKDEIVAALARSKDTSDLQVENLEIPPLAVEDLRRTLAEQTKNETN